MIKIKVKNFDLNLTLLSEQCPAEFWYKTSVWISYLKIDNIWTKVLLKQKNNYLYVNTFPKVNKEVLIEKLNYIFWLDYPVEDLESLYDDNKLRKIIEKYKNIRVMREDNYVYRTYFGVVAQNINIKRIKKIHNLLFKTYGDYVDYLNVFTYPVLKRIYKKSEELKKCKLGYRAEYLKNIVNAIVEKRFIPENLFKLPSKEGIKILKQFKGIGDKIAEMILMYAYGKRDVFPIDVWVRRSLDKLEIENPKEYFKEHSSIMNLILFLNERNARFYNFNCWK